MYIFTFFVHTIYIQIKWRCLKWEIKKIIKTTKTIAITITIKITKIIAKITIDNFLKSQTMALFKLSLILNFLLAINLFLHNLVYIFLLNYKIPHYDLHVSYDKVHELLLHPFYLLVTLLALN